MSPTDTTVAPAEGLTERARNPRVLRLSPADNLVVAIEPILPGATAEGVTALARVPKGHKMATAAIAVGEPIRKFGQIIGFATVPIRPGEHIHTHNCGVTEFARDYHFAEDARPEHVLPLAERRTFQGFRRKNGKVGTRNYIGMLTSVNCSAIVARIIADAFNRTDILEDFPNIDGVVPFVMGWGCGMAGRGSEGYEVLQRTAVGLRQPPQPRRRADGRARLRGDADLRSGRRLRPEGERRLPHHDHPGHRRHAQDGRARRRDDQGDARRGQRRHARGRCRSRRSCWRCNAAARTAIPASPPTRRWASPPTCWSSRAARRCSAETPEIYGAEHLLTRRAATREIGEKLVDIIHWWEDYTARNAAR